MILPDVNILIHAFRRGDPNHTKYSELLRSWIEGQEPFGMSPLVLSGVVRVTTNPRAYPDPNTPEDALDFCKSILDCQNCVVVTPGSRHWDIFDSLVRSSGARGPLVPDAYLAALAIEHGCEWVTLDKDFKRFKGLKWRLLK